MAPCFCVQEGKDEYQRAARQGSARINQEKTHAVKFAVHSSTRRSAKQSAASTRRHTVVNQTDLARPTRGTTS